MHAGDFTRRGKPDEIREFNEWLGTLPHPHKVVIAGNHDFLFENEPESAQKLITNAIYLEDSGTEIEGLKIWGSPVSPRFFDWAFNRDRGEDIQNHWDKIPDSTDILLIHGPPAGILDQVFWFKRHVGCENLKATIDKIQPRYVVFGHIHEAYGQLTQDGVTYINASSLDRKYRNIQPPIIIDL